MFKSSASAKDLNMEEIGAVFGVRKRTVTRYLGARCGRPHCLTLIAFPTHALYNPGRSNNRVKLPEIY